MNRFDWLTLFVAFEGAPSGLDPVRLQKGMFLFAQEAETVPPGEKYVFRPYSYGPMSREIYTDLDRLAEQGLVEQVPVEGQTWSRYKPTNRGVERAHRLMREALARHDRDTKHFYRIKQVVAQTSFADLLEGVYDRYPEYAANSIFKRR
jgi:uncharacterized protein YwgA